MGSGVPEASNLYTKKGADANSPVKTTNGQVRSAEGSTFPDIVDKFDHTFSSAFNLLFPITISAYYKYLYLFFI